MADRGSSYNPAGEEHGRSELRVVLLGGRCSGKSSAGNTILGKEAFQTGGRTDRCGARQGVVDARRVTVVDTPGWWCDFYVRDTAELLKEEMVWRAGALCPPGPHAFLLVVKASSAFTEKRRRAVEEHLELLGERVWERTLVLFTWGDWLGHTSVPQHIQKQGKALEWLVEKCGNRYHSLNNKSPATAAQVTELLAKLDEMVAGNGGRHHEMDRKASQEEEERREALKERVKQRLAEVRMQRSLLTGLGRSLPELRMVLLGAHKSGKSSAGNCILGRSEFQVAVRTVSCSAGRGQTSGRRVVVIDTPGWWMNYFAEESPEFDRREVRRSVGLAGPGPHALLVAVRADKAFSETHRRALEEHLELLGGAVWRHAVLLFTFGDWLGGKTPEEHIEREGGALRWLAEKCGNRYHVLSGRNGGDGDQVTRLLERVEEMVAGNGGSHYEPGGTLQDDEENRNAEEQRANERMSKVQDERRAIRSLHPGGVPTLSNLTVVLLGGVSAGKSSAGNTILGREEFEAGQKTGRWRKGQGRTSGRSVTVVDTPGWQRGHSVGKEVAERAIWDGPSLRSLKPNALLLVVNVSSSFTETHRRAAEEGMALLGEWAWGLALVLFTNGDWLGDTTIEQRIESEGSALWWLVERCGNRYHVFNNKGKKDCTQVAELLEKIEEMEARGREDLREQRKEEETPTELQEQHLEEELDKDQLSHFLTKRGSSGKNSENRDSLKLHILPLCSLVLQSTSRAGRSHRKSSMPGRGQEEPQAHQSGGPSQLIDRHVGNDARGLLVKGPGRKSQNLLLVLPGDRLKVLSWRSPEGTGEVLGKVWAEHTAVLLTRVEALSEGAAEDPVQTSRGDTQEKSTIEELESFIDAYFETVREGAEKTQQGDEMRSQQLCSGKPPARDNRGQAELGYWSLSSTDQQLSKLNMLEAMQKRLMEMDQTLQLSCQIIQELSGKGKEAHSSVKSANGEEPGESASR